VTYRLTPLAKEHLRDIEDYTDEKWSVDQSIIYTSEIIKRLEMLSDFPRAGRLIEGHEDHETRKFPLKYHIIIYHCVGEDIEILGIPHGDKDPMNYLKN